MQKDARQTVERGPLYTKLRKLKLKDDVVVARFQSGGFHRESHMATKMFARMAILGIKLLSRNGLLPTFTVLEKIERVGEDRVIFALGFRDDPELCIEAHVSLDVAEEGRDKLNKMLPVNVRHICVRGRL